TERYADAASRVQRLELVDDELAAAGKTDHGVDELLEAARKDLPTEVAELQESWPATVAAYSGDEHTVRVRDREITTRLTTESLSGTKVPRVALPRYRDAGDLVRFWRRENLPGHFPFTAGVFAFKRAN